MNMSTWTVSAFFLLFFVRPHQTQSGVPVPLGGDEAACLLRRPSERDISENGTLFCTWVAKGERMSRTVMFWQTQPDSRLVPLTPGSDWIVACPTELPGGGEDWDCFAKESPAVLIEDRSGAAAVAGTASTTSTYSTSTHSSTTLPSFSSSTATTSTTTTSTTSTVSLPPPDPVIEGTVEVVPSGSIVAADGQGSVSKSLCFFRVLYSW